MNENDWEKGIIFHIKSPYKMKDSKYHITNIWTIFVFTED